MFTVFVSIKILLTTCLYMKESGISILSFVIKHYRKCMYKIHTVKAIYIKIKEAPNSAVVSPKALVDINFNDKVLQSGTSFDTI